MKKILLTLCVALVSTCSFAQKGEQKIGLNLSYGTEISNIGLGAKYQYGITDAIRLEGSFDYFFKKDNLSMWDINVNAHYLFPISEKFKVYPLVGLTYTNWKCKLDWESSNEDYSGAGLFSGENDHNFWADDSEGSSSSSTGKFGVNLGGGIQYDINTKWTANFEVKYQLISDYNQAVFGIGIAYKF